MAQKPATTRIPRQLRESDVHGKGAAEIGWGTPGDFDRCRAFMRRHDVPGREIDGACANLHRIATGEWPGKNAHKGHLASVAVISLTAAAGPADADMVRWHGPLALVGEATGDRRRFPNDTLKYQSFPQPFRFQRQGLPGHQGAVTVGVIEHAQEQMYPDDGPQKELRGKRVIWGDGYFLDASIIPEVAEAIHLAENGVTGPSVDLDSYTAVLKKNTMSGETTADMVRGRQRAATLVSVPAFADLRITVVHPKALTASSDAFAVNSSGWHGAPIAPREALFDADDAAKRIEGWANGDPKKMASMFLWIADSANAPLIGRKGYRLPWGDIIDGKPYLIYHAVYAAAALLEGAHGGLPAVPDEEKAKLRTVISSIYEDLSAEFNDPSIIAPWDRAAQAQQASGEVAWTSADGDEYDSYACSFDAALQEFRGRYTESKHPRDPRKNDHAGEWVDVPKHDAHGRIKVGSKWVYPPKKGEKGASNPEAAVRAKAKRGAGTQVGKKRPDPGSDAGRQRHTVRHGPSTTERERARDKERARELREVAGNHKPEPREAPKRKAPEKKAEPQPKAEPKKEPVKAEPEGKAPEKKAPARKAVVGKKQPVHKVTPAQQKAMEALRDDENAKIHPATRKVLQREGYLDENGKLTDKAHEHLGSKPKEKPEPKAKTPEPEPKKAPARKAVVGKKQPAEHKLTAAQQRALEANAKDPGYGVHPATRKVLEREGYLDPKTGRLTKKALDHLGIDKQPDDRPAPSPKKAVVAPKKATAAIDAGKKSDKPRKNNSWGGIREGDDVHFHPDGAIGGAIRSLGKDADMEVDGDRLDNVLGGIATDGAVGDITGQQQLDRLKQLRDRLPEGRAKNAVAGAVQEIDTPMRPAPESVKGAPQPLVELMDEFRQIPLARGNRIGAGHKPEMDVLDDILKKWHDGELSPLRLQAEVRKLVDFHHESQEGHIGVRVAVSRALDKLKQMKRDDLVPGAHKPKLAPKPKTPEGLSKDLLPAVAKYMEYLDGEYKVLGERVQHASNRAELLQVDDDLKETLDSLRRDEKEIAVFLKATPDNARLLAHHQAILKHLKNHEALKEQLDKKKADLGADKGPESIGDPEGEKLGKRFSSGKESGRRRVAKGAQGKKEILTYPDGHKIFRKEFPHEGLGRRGSDEADAEELASLLGRAIGAPVPTVYRNGDRDILMDHIDGVTYGDVPFGERDKIIREPAETMIGLLDVLIGNTDRHSGNLMVDKENRLIGIDHGLAWGDVSAAGPPGRKGDHGAAARIHRRDVIGPGRAFAGGKNPLTEADVKKLFKKLEALRPAFKKRGKERWLDFSLAAVADLAQDTGGKKNLIS